MNKLALGTVQFGLRYGIANKSGKIKFSIAKDIINLANKKKIDLLDTAIAYGDSEKVIGKIGVKNFKIVSKLPNPPKKIIDIQSWIENEVKNCLDRLGIESLYGLLIHQTDILLDERGKAIIDTLYKLKHLKLVKNIGVSIYDPSELDQVMKLMKINIVQAPLNIIDRRLETSGWLSQLTKDNIEVHTRSTFLQGLLLLSRNNIPLIFDKWSNIWDQWAHELKKNEFDAASVCLSYPLSLTGVNRVIVGVDNLDQFDNLIKASKSKFNIENWTFMSSSDPKLINTFEWASL